MIPINDRILSHRARSRSGRVEAIEYSQREDAHKDELAGVPCSDRSLAHTAQRPPRKGGALWYPAIGTNTSTLPIPNHLRIPGTNRDNYATCAEPIAISRCVDCGFFQVWRNHCQNLDCSMCFAAEVNRSAVLAMQRLHGYQALTGSADPRHVVLSFPPGYSPSSLKQIQKKFKNFQHEYFSGISGVYVVHMFRVRPDVQEEIRACENRSKFGIWEDVHSDLLELGDWKAYVYISPHIHMVCFGRLPNAAELYERTGCVYKNIGPRSFEFRMQTRGFGYTNEVMRTLAYQGTHALIDGNDKQHRLFSSFGKCSPYYMRKIGKEEKPVVLPLRCSACGSANIERTELTLQYDGTVVEGKVQKEKPWRFVWDCFQFAEHHADESSLFTQKIGVLSL